MQGACLQCKGDGAVLAILVGETKACSHWYLGANYALAAVEVVFLQVHVHAAAHSLAGTIHLTHEFYRADLSQGLMLYNCICLAI